MLLNIKTKKAEKVITTLKYLIGYPLSDSFFHSDEQPEVNLENDYQNKTGHNLETIIARFKFCKMYLIVHNLCNQTVCKN